MSKLKSTEDIAALREGGRRLARVMDALIPHVLPGTTTLFLDQLAERLIREGGDTPAFKGYQPDGADYPFPATVCISINEEVVHGIPGDRSLQEGDIVSLDMGLSHKGLIVDMARTLPVGHVDEALQKLLSKTKDALNLGIKAAKAGARVGDISAAIEKVAIAEGYGVIRDLGGHGVGHAVHELPFVPNYGKAGTGPKLEVGMVLALEPMFTLGGDDVEVRDDGYTYATVDRALSAHFEHTIVITEDVAEVVTA